jgi:hypothetical protein
MRSTIDLHQRIAECARQAESAPNALARIQWKRMEQFWRMKCPAPKPAESLTFVEPSPPTISTSSLRHLGTSAAWKGELGDRDLQKGANEIAAGNPASWKVKA